MTDIFKNSKSVGFAKGQVTNQKVWVARINCFNGINGIGGFKDFLEFDFVKDTPYRFADLNLIIDNQERDFAGIEVVFSSSYGPYPLLPASFLSVGPLDEGSRTLVRRCGSLGLPPQLSGLFRLTGLVLCNARP